MCVISVRSSAFGAVVSGAFFVGIACCFAASAGQNPLAAPVADSSRVGDALKDLNRGQSFGQVAISPDGKRLAWVLELSREDTEIRVAAASDLEKSERVTVATKQDQHCREGELAWAPDSKSLAFFSDCADPRPPG